MPRRAAVFSILLIILLIDFGALEGAQLKQTALNGQKTVTEDPSEGRPVMWEEPVDLESRDLFHGIGGKKGEPDPSANYRKEKEHRGDQAAQENRAASEAFVWHSVPGFKRKNLRRTPSAKARVANVCCASRRNLGTIMKPAYPYLNTTQF